MLLGVLLLALALPAQAAMTTRAVEYRAGDTVLTGVVFSEALFGQPLRPDHKTIFTLLAWAIFGVLLLGRHAWGWRGRVALRWTWAG